MLLLLVALCVLRREAEVLSLFAAIINKLKGNMETEVPRIFEAVFECTLQMITKNFEVRRCIRPSTRATSSRAPRPHGDQQSDSACQIGPIISYWFQWSCRSSLRPAAVQLCPAVLGFGLGFRLSQKP
jgi:CRM1 C terminal